MPFDPFQELILSELREMKVDLKEVRQADIPSIKTDVAGFRTEIENLKTSQKWSTRLYTVIGGAIAVIITKVTGHN